MIYRNAFARHDVERMRMAVEENIQSYEDFAKDTTKTVNAKDLYPYEIVGEAITLTNYSHSFWGGYRDDKEIDSTQRAIINKYWDNYLNSFDDFRFNGLAVVDTSASMLHYGAKDQPMNIAISLGMCCAEKAIGPFHGHYISFSSRPQLVPVEGVDFVDTVRRIYSTNICENTNIEATFDLLLETARLNRCAQEDLPENIIIISDMEFDAATGGWNWRVNGGINTGNIDTVMDSIARKWERYGYEVPNLIFWNVDARQNNIPMLGNRVSYVSGMSPSIYRMIATGKTGYDLMMETLDSERYKAVV